MIQRVEFHIDELESMKNYPKEIFYKGNLALLQQRKVAIVGSRKPNAYARAMTAQLALKLAQNGLIIVSGGAIGVDALAHKNAGAKNTIMVAATGLDKQYPAINKNLITQIEQEGLVLSQFETATPAHKYNFVLRNELTVALAEVLIVTYADENSGTMRSVEYAQKMGKKIYVLPHRIGESIGTNKLLSQNQAEAIYDMDAFVKELAPASRVELKKEDDFLIFCATNPTYEETLKKFPTRVFEAELSGIITIVNGRVRVST
ncbi:DNA-processing protein DprA [Sulfurimonas sp.]